MSFKVNIKKIAPQQVLSITSRVKVDKLDDTIRQSLDKLYESLKQQKVVAADAPFGIFHGQINEQEDGPIEVCVPVNGKVKVGGDIALKTLQGGDATSVMLSGVQCDFPAILGGYDAAADWIQRNGHEMLERPREVWHTAPGLDAKMEIIWLFK